MNNEAWGSRWVRELGWRWAPMPHGGAAAAACTEPSGLPRAPALRPELGLLWAGVPLWHGSARWVWLPVWAEHRFCLNAPPVA